MIFKQLIKSLPQGLFKFSSAAYQVSQMTENIGQAIQIMANDQAFLDEVGKADDMFLDFVDQTKALIQVQWEAFLEDIKENTDLPEKFKPIKNNVLFKEYWDKGDKSEKKYRKAIKELLEFLVSDDNEVGDRIKEIQDRLFPKPNSEINKTNK